MNVMGILALEILWPSHIAATGRATKKLLSLPSAVPQAEIGHLISGKNGRHADAYNGNRSHE
jgi:hypothetical protein